MSRIFAIHRVVVVSSRFVKNRDRAESCTELSRALERSERGSERSCISFAQGRWTFPYRSPGKTTLRRIFVQTGDAWIRDIQPPAIVRLSTHYAPLVRTRTIHEAKINRARKELSSDFFKACIRSVTDFQSNIFLKQYFDELYFIVILRINDYSFIRCINSQKWKEIAILMSKCRYKNIRESLLRL